MKKTNFKTFRTLLIKDNMRANDLAQFVKINGVLHRNRWGVWEAFLPGNAATKDVIETALNEIADCVSAYTYRDSSVEDYEDRSIPLPLDNFGFKVGDNNKFFIEKTALQTQQELIAQLQSELASAKHPAKPKANKGRWAERDKHKEEVRKVAKRLWEEDDTQTIADITLLDEINEITKSNGTNYSERTLRDWIKDLAPSNKPGRPKEN